MRSVTARFLLGPVVLGVALAGLLAGPAQGDDQARVHVVQGLVGEVVEVSLDGRVVASGVDGASVAGPFDLAPGDHVLEVATSAGTVVSSTLELAAGTDQDVVVHLPATQGEPVVTVFDNELAPVPPGRGRLVVTHTAAVPPADIVVDGQVLFANVANGESLDDVVPAGGYEVQVVPTGRSGPALVGPADLSVEAGTLTRVFAVGDPATDGMDVVVHVLPTGTVGSAAPGRIDTGSGGQASGLVLTSTGGWPGRDR